MSFIFLQALCLSLLLDGACVQSSTTLNAERERRAYIKGCNLSKDCGDILHRNPDSPSGVYTIYPFQNNFGYETYCDMETECGGWTVIQRRMDGSENFKRNWTDYQYGFGDRQKEFWIGNDALHLLTEQRNYELRIDLEDFSHTKRVAKYKQFAVGSEKQNYNLTIGGYSGNAGDSLGPFHNHRTFKTIDKKSGHCSSRYGGGGWWYGSCHAVNINGQYYTRGHTKEYAKGLVWFHWRGYHYSLKNTIMMVRHLI